MSDTTLHDAYEQFEKDWIIQQELIAFEKDREDSHFHIEETRNNLIAVSLYTIAHNLDGIFQSIARIEGILKKES